MPIKWKKIILGSVFWVNLTYELFHILSVLFKLNVQNMCLSNKTAGKVKGGVRGKDCKRLANQHISSSICHKFLHFPQRDSLFGVSVSAVFFIIS